MNHNDISSLTIDGTEGYSPFIYKRRRSIEVNIGDTPIGENNPIRIQSMASVSTMDTDEAVEQAQRVIDAGADYLRFTAQGVKEANNLGVIRERLTGKGYKTPLVADIHFNPKAADAALDSVEKVRINPGNYVDTKYTVPKTWDDTEFTEMNKVVQERFGEFVEKAKKLKRAIRIGVNHGSLSERMMARYGDSPRGMVESCLEYLRVCLDHDFKDIVISMKSSNTIVMTQAVRLLVKTLEEQRLPAFPLHLGVTEAGEGEDGRIKSAVGIGSLLADGLGDTIRVSLSEDPEFEIPVAIKLRDYIVEREKQLPLTEVLPTAHEYELYKQNARKDTFCVKGLIGGNALPVVISTKATEEQIKEWEMKPDLTLNRGEYRTTNGTNMGDVRFVEADYLTLTEELEHEIKSHPNTVVILNTSGINPVAEWRLGFTWLRKKGIKAPIILKKVYDEQDLSSFRLECAADVGSILLDGWSNGLMISAPSLPENKVVATMYGILQASRLRMSKTEFISCPSCGRTLYNIQETIGKIKAATSHLKGLKIGIMGCIVNGPGEMADADYGYVGSGPGKIDLYKQQEKVRKGIPQEEAVEQLVNLIKENGDWQEPS